jgi:small subunit ribosomal protein S21
MLIIPVKEGENIERALKKFKKKFDKTKAMKELRRRKEFTKPSVVKRQDNIRAVYREKIMSVGQ